MPAKRASYRDAVAWIAGNDDTEFMDAERGQECLSVTAALVIDLFGVPESKFRADLRRELDRQGRTG